MTENVKLFLGKIDSSDADVRYAAWRSAGPQGAQAVAPLCERLDGADRGVGKAAKGALQAIVHHAARPGAATEASTVSAALLKVAQSERSAPTRGYALHLLGLTSPGGSSSSVWVTGYAPPRGSFEAA